jgi:CubicO group peptidase (beta-lactamase class C family)
MPVKEVQAVTESGTAADLSAVDLGAVDQLAAAFAERAGQPGLAYGVVAGGVLAHSGGLGERWLGGPRPAADTVFRIASMTKSFTASAILLLRDTGRLRLDDLAEDYVGELRDLRLPSSDCPRVTIRHLLTMTAGFPTDDPWGDRQQGLPAEDFARLLKGGVRLGWAPGTRFEYSNLGYATLGKVIEAVTGGDYAEAVRRLLLRPLGLTRTGYELTEFQPPDVARGYQRDSGGWRELAPDPYGAFAPMGGVFSTVADLAQWVAGFADAFPPRDDPGDGAAPGAAHPLSRASRREMQLPQIAIVSPHGGTFPDHSTASYGFGLFIEEDPAFGTIVQHSGGYPGYGSQMRWHQPTGIGTIVLGNGTYAAAGQLAARLLAEILGQLRATGAGLPRTAPAGNPLSSTALGSTALGGAGAGSAAPVAGVFGPAPAGGPWAQTLAARGEVDELLLGWDDEVASKIFAPNVGWDQSFADRRAAIGAVRERIGAFRADPDRLPEFDSPAQCRWWLRGERGTVQVEIGLAPLVEPLVQSLRLAVPPAPGSGLLRLLDSLIGLINDGSGAVWPDWLAAAADVDITQLMRQLRVAAAWAGRCSAGAFRAGDGEMRTSVELEGQSGRAILSLAVDEAGETLRQADITLLS